MSKDLYDLIRVVTVSEAARHWQRSVPTIRYACDKGYITARYSGATQLITVQSLIAHYGAPAIPLTELLLNV